MKKNTEGSLPRWVLLAVCMAFFASAAQSAYIAKELINDTSNSFIISQGDGLPPPTPLLSPLMRRSATQAALRGRGWDWNGGD
jgi:hypothetical protein